MAFPESDKRKLGISIYLQIKWRENTPKMLKKRLKWDEGEDSVQ